MEIQIEPHTLERAEERGTNASEIRDVITTGFPVPAKYNRIAKAKIYEFNQARGGITFRQKRVEVIYSERSDMITTVTVYVFYGSWEGEYADPL